MDKAKQLFLKRTLWGIAAAALVGSAATLASHNPIAGTQAGYAAWKLAGFMVTGNYQHLVPAAFMAGVAAGCFSNGFDLATTVRHLMSLQTEMMTLTTGGLASLHSFFNPRNIGSLVENVAEDLLGGDANAPEKTLRMAKPDMRLAS